MDVMMMISETSDLQLEVTQAKPCLLNSAGSGLASAFSQVHPRACGEQWHNKHPAEPGSSPRVRGTATSPFIFSGFSTVHPRACGEQQTDAAGHEHDYGSSPRVRGTVTGIGPLKRQVRFIPARAGNRHVRRSLFPSRQVLPRACGEQETSVLFAGFMFGSSPRVRGTDEQLAQYVLLRRFIPARAGNSSLGTSVSAINTVHPRACGEQIY